jgi:hypothetical protein
LARFLCGKQDLVGKEAFLRVDERLLVALWSILQGDGVWRLDLIEFHEIARLTGLDPKAFMARMLYPDQVKTTTAKATRKR